MENTSPMHRLMGRENSFTFLRLLLAVAVVYGHAWVLGGFGEEPTARWTRRAIAGREIAVQGFFALSGFLIAKSLASQSSLWRFACHRVFRIFPALWIYLLLMVFVAAPLLIESHHPGQWSYAEKLTQGTLSPLAYLAHHASARPGGFSMSSVFTEHPVAQVPNGSLWSIQIELSFYMLAALGTWARRLTVRRGLLMIGLGLIGSLAMDSVAAGFLALAAAWCLLVRRASWSLPILFLAVYSSSLLDTFWPAAREAIATVPFAVVTLPLLNQMWHAPALAFLGGMLIWQGRNWIRWDARLFALSLALLVIGAWTRHWTLVMPLALPYALLFLAARLPFTGLERWGDYSYGIYIFSFPIQQLLIQAGWHRFGPNGYAAASILLSVLAGVASWFLIERPALRLGQKLGRWSWSRPAPVTATAPAAELVKTAQ